LNRFEKDLSVARQVLKESSWCGQRVAEAAAWTIVANVLLNLDEMVTKE